MGPINDVHVPAQCSNCKNSRFAARFMAMLLRYFSYAFDLACKTRILFSCSFPDRRCGLEKGRSRMVTIRTGEELVLGPLGECK